MDIVTLSLAKKYTNDSLSGAGAVAGKPCTIKNIDKVDKKNTVTFEWTKNDGSTTTSQMIVEDGADPNEITSIAIDTSDNHVKVTMADGTVYDAGEMPMEPVKVSAESGNALVEKADGLYVSTTGVEISAKADNIIKAETDGLYAKADEITISAKTNNIITKETDGLYVPSGLEIDDTTTTSTDKTWSAKQINDSIKVNTDAIDILNGDATVSGSVTKQITEAIAKLNKLEKQIVDTLPSVADADANTIYLIKQGDTTTYDMYTLVTLADGSKSLASMGGTEIDLDGYAKTDDVVLLQQSITDKGKSLIVGDDGKVIVGNAQIDIVTEFSETPSDDKVPSEKLVSDTLTQELSKKVDIQQDIAEKGKALVVGDDGKLLLGTVATDGLEIVDKTQAEYDALTDAEKNDPTKLYNITDAEDVDISLYVKKSELDKLMYYSTGDVWGNDGSVDLILAGTISTDGTKVTFSIQFDKEIKASKSTISAVANYMYLRQEGKSQLAVDNPKITTLNVGKHSIQFTINVSGYASLSTCVLVLDQLTINF